MWNHIKSGLFSIVLQAGSVINHNRNSKVIYYHDIHKDGRKPATPMSTPLNLFYKHLITIRKLNFEIVTEITAAENQIKITFDDGFRGLYENIDFIMREKLSPTVYLVSSFLGKKGYLNRNEITELQANGLIFQSHTHSHYDLVNLSDNELKLELKISKNILEELLLKPITDLCFPRGIYNKRVITEANSAGYLNLYSSIPGYFFEKDINNIIHRNLVQDLGIKDLNSVLFGGSSILQGRYKKQHFYGN